MTSRLFKRSRKPPYAAIKSADEFPAALKKKLELAIAEKDLCTIGFIRDVAEFKSSHGKPLHIGEFKSIVQTASDFLIGVTSQAKEGIAN